MTAGIPHVQLRMDLLHSSAIAVTCPASYQGPGSGMGLLKTHIFSSLYLHRGQWRLLYLHFLQ